MQGEMNAFAQPSVASQSGSKLDNRRMLAALIDLAIVGVGAAAVLATAGALGGDGAKLGAPLVGVAVCWGLYYYFACESGGGQTLGKKLMKLRVVRVDGNAAGLREVAMRTALRVVDTALVGLIAMLVSGERRGRLGDLAAGTMIVSTEAPPTIPTPPSIATSPATAVAAMPLGDAPHVAPAEAPAPPEIRPFEPVVEPDEDEDEPAEAAEAPEAPAATEDAPEAPAEPVVQVADEPSVEVAPAAEPVVDVAPASAEPVVDVAPAPAEPVVDVAPAAEPVVDIAPPPAEPPAPQAEQVVEVTDAPVVEVTDEPVAELSVVQEPAVDIATPSLKELAQDVVAATDTERPATDAERPAAEPVVEVAGPDEDEAAAPEMTVRSVETVSAIDLVMGDDEPAQDPPAGDQPTSGPSVA
jgi:uncharacterized RDD family membrane protein YckC